MPVRLRKRTSNLFRPRAEVATTLDVTPFEGVLQVDTASRTADVLGMTTYEDLVDATLPHGLMPKVVPQLKTITLGGAVTGLGIESTSFRNGCPHESVLEMEVLTGAGEVLTVSPAEHSDLFYGFPNSYGSLGYALRLRIELEPVRPYVHLRHVRYDDIGRCAEAIADLCAEPTIDGDEAAFLDGVWFGRDEVYLTLGSWADEAPYTSDYTDNDVYYRSLQTRQHDWLTVRDYLWRWDTDWFWCSRAFGAQQPLIRRAWPKRWLRSSFYWKLVALDRRFDIANRLERLHKRPPFERVVQDIEVPVGNTAAFVDWFLDTIPIEPIWLCPLQLPVEPGRRLASDAPDTARRDEPTWPLYPIPPGRTYVNVGFWSVVPEQPGQVEGATNRVIEKRVTDLGGHKSLYSD